MVIRLENFMGIAPRIIDQRIPSNAGTVASNCKLFSGALLPFDGQTTVPAVSIDGATKSLYRKRSNDTWTGFINDTNVARSPIANDAYDRVYWTDDDASTLPKMGANEIFTTAYDLGIPAPTTAPIATAVGPPDPDPLQSEIRAYVVTYASAYGEEGPPSAVDVPQYVTVFPETQTVNLTSIPTGPVTGAHNITTKNIYRTNTGSQSTQYQLVASLPIANTTYNDAVESNNLGIVMPSENWDMPPAKMQGLSTHPAGFLVGFNGREVVLSEQYLPHAWPVANKYPVDSDIIAVAVFGTTIIVLTEKMPYLLSGNTPNAMYLEKPETGYACLSKRGVVDMGEFVLYPSASGLVAIGVGTPAVLITEEVFDEKDWALYKPLLLDGYRLDYKYFGVCGTGAFAQGFVFNVKNKSFVTLSSMAAMAGNYDETDGALYLKGSIGDTTLKEWDSDANNKLTYDWKSKEFVVPTPTSFGACQVYAEAFPVTVKVYADGSLIHTEAVASQIPFRLPGGVLADKWHIEVLGINEVNSVLMANTMTELKGL
jgi:hypothetical protein